jgi:CheY-like chemotaxis protein
MMQPVIGEHVKIVTRLDPHLSPVFADAGQLGQVLVNLALNARDAMPGGGVLTIETENTTLDQRADDAAAIPLPRGSYVRLTMRDSGVGMDADTLARAFEPFFTTKAHGKGSGLGLATVYGIVKQSFGDIHATSVPNVGSAFSVLLPVAHSPVESPPPRSSYGQIEVPSWSRQRSVLLVEDNDGVREFAEVVLVRAGYIVRSAHSGVDALERLRAADFVPDLVVTDVVMPEMGGRELVERLRERYPELPVLYITGYTDDSRMLSALHTDDARLLEKPFTPRALEIAVQELTEVVVH